ncbi:hypothetical protein LTR56_013110 [Elasticomyces elasticus]|nr:hypothetical protein LTR56_013110 [Elasticomyces elasticus]KAK3640289.1 hypothetical protein LTR22_017124 [Elasticomyces elasticus]KAK4920566.1 hypothetical protein LTR49_011981 [Elasticomyces elasticus]KAK5758934.1 hypothetical protein LTS12_010875 [Elasticomyces elasticus]
MNRCYLLHPDIGLPCLPIIAYKYFPALDATRPMMNSILSRLAYVHRDDDQSSGRDNVLRESPIASVDDFRAFDDTYERLKKLKLGSQGEVCIARSDTSHKLLVIKHTKLREAMKPDRSGTVYRYPHEAQILLSKLKPHPNIIRAFNIEPSHEPGRRLIFMEYCSGGDLADQLDHFAKLRTRHCSPYPVARRHRRCLVPEVFLWHVFVSLAEALAYIHHGLRRSANGEYVEDENHEAVIHADIKPDNVLLRWPTNGNPTATLYGLPDIVLTDFGSSRLARESKGTAGTAEYLAPEVHAISALKQINKELYAQAHRNPNIVMTASDIYQLGGLVYELATRELWPCNRETERLQLPKEYPRHKLRGLEKSLAWCLEPKATARPHATAHKYRGLLGVTEDLRAQRDGMVEGYGALPRRIWSAPGTGHV